MGEAFTSGASVVAAKALDGVCGAYLMPQFGKYKTAIEVLEVLR